MKFFATPGATAGWVLGKVNLLEELIRIASSEGEWSTLKNGMFAEGPVRLVANHDLSLILFWNVDYVSGSGDDSWGLINISETDGLFCEPSIIRETFERSLYLISQRSQGLLIDGAYIHRSHSNGVHTCLSGRGSEARQKSLGYLESSNSSNGMNTNIVFVSGPAFDLNKLVEKTLQLSEGVQSVLDELNQKFRNPGGADLLSSSSFSDFRGFLNDCIPGRNTKGEYESVNFVSGAPIPEGERYLFSYSWSYSQWLADSSPITLDQRRLVAESCVPKHPIRLIGPAGSGKTLLMQLLAVNSIKLRCVDGGELRILFLVHNQRMAEMAQQRFDILFEGESFGRYAGAINVQTLTDYAITELGLANDQIIDSDAQTAKEFQYEVLENAIETIFESEREKISNLPMLSSIASNSSLRQVFCQMIAAEISVSIKGRGLQADRKRYVESDSSFSRFHGTLNQDERKVIFDIFVEYNKIVFDGYNVLDTDDVALSLLGKLRTPMWQMRRRSIGFDHVYVDECQLFNENEKRVFPLLTKSSLPFVPVTIALDDAQDVHGQISSGLATLGIENIATESLSSIHRSSAPIVRLAFYIIQRSTQLFTPDFPDFTSVEFQDDGRPSAVNVPVSIWQNAEQKSFERFVVKHIRALRKANCRRIAVICMAEIYWSKLLDSLRGSDLPLHVLEERGQVLPMSDPVVVFSRPQHIGGQEFDDVLIVGAEEGVSPPRVNGNDALASAVEQQNFRELYLAITRARNRVFFLQSAGAGLSPVLADALGDGLINRG